jgi:hypothetical protein
MNTRLVAQLHGQLVDRMKAWLRAEHDITMRELELSPRSVQEDIGAAWIRYWREECLAGRGIKFPPRSQLFSGPTRTARSR